MDPTPEQRIKALETQLREQKRRHEKQLKDSTDLILLLRTKLPRLGTRKLLHKIAPRLRAQGVACGRDALFTLLRQRGLLVPKKRRYPKTIDSHHRFYKHPNRVKDASKPNAPNLLHVSDITYLLTRQGTG